MICIKCVTSVSDDSRYCPQCGQATTLADVAPMQADAALTDMADNGKPVNALETIRATSHLATPTTAAPTPADTQKLHTRLSQANLCRMRGDWSGAVDHCVAVLQEQPANATAHSLLSDIYRDQGKLDDAIQWIRLAIELKPSPADSAKLQKLELERTHLMRQGDSRLLGSGLSRSMALAADGGVPDGTVKLMGYSPRKWLNGMTTAAMVFVGAVLLVLVGMRYTRHEAPRPVFNSYASGTNAYGNKALPPASLPGRASGFTASRIAVNTGLPPDLQSSPIVVHRPLANAPNVPVNLPPAPVLNVRPSVPNSAGSSSGAIAVTGASSTGQAGDATALPDGMWIASVRFPAAGDARVNIGMNLASPAQLRPEGHEAVLRNVYRAARRLFDKYETVGRIAVTAQTDPAETVVFSAQVARAAAMQLNPDTAPAPQLENGLQAAHWAETEASPGATSPVSTAGIPGMGQ